LSPENRHQYAVNRVCILCLFHLNDIYKFMCFSLEDRLDSEESISTESL